MSTIRSRLPRLLLGGALGAAAYLLLSFVTQPGALFGGSLELAFTFCFDSRVPEVLGAALGIALWFAFGAETAVATLPFAAEGRALLLRSLAHLALMALTLAAWVLLNFGAAELPFFLVPFLLVYALIWLGRWVGWCAELAAIREKLGLAPGRSLFHWRETLPYVPFAALLCLLLPFVLRLCDAGDVPVLSGLLYPYLLLPVGAFCSALSLGKRQGFCPLYPVACAGFLFCFALLARLVSNVADADMLPIAFLAALVGNLAGAALRRRRGGAGE